MDQVDPNLPRGLLMLDTHQVEGRPWHVQLFGLENLVALVLKIPASLEVEKLQLFH